MLALDDARWGDLSHCCGPAENIPKLLREMAEAPGPRGWDEEPCYSLWSSLCHQGDVYTASYAAVPHIVSVALSAAAPIDLSFFLLPAAIEIARASGRGPQIPTFLQPSYQEAIKLLADCVSAHRAEEWNQDMALSAATGLAVSKGHYELGEALMNLDADWIARIIRDERE